MSSFNPIELNLGGAQANINDVTNKFETLKETKLNLSPAKVDSNIVPIDHMDFGTVKKTPPSPKFFSNPRGMVASFAQHAANQGFQRSNRFIVLLHGPNVNGQFLQSVNTSALQNGDIMGPMFPPNNSVSNPPLLRTRDIVDFSSAIDIRMKERLALVCQEAQLPSKGLMTEDFLSTGSGAPLYHAYAENFTGELTLSFLCSSDMFERMYFSSWIERIVNRGTHEVAMYDKYAMPWKIIVAALPADLSAGTGSRGASLDDVASNFSDSSKPSDFYFVQFEHVYPYKLSQQQLSMSDKDQNLKLDVTFKYTRWFDPVNKYYNQLADPNTRIGLKEEPVSPWEKFKKIARAVVKYSDPREMRGLIINEGLGALNDVVGEGVVENIAYGGQVAGVMLDKPGAPGSLIPSPKDYVRDVIRG
jgi:hypothetical protein